jgi:hypothetical protein
MLRQATKISYEYLQTINKNIMISKFFLFGGKTYLNNAIVIADILSVVEDIFGDTTNFSIKFKKPFNSQADLKFSTDPIDGHTVGSFNTKLTKFYFSYTPIEIVLPNKIIDPSEVNYFNVSYAITDACRGMVEECFENEFGSMSSTDKVIFALTDIPDTSIINNIIKNKHKPKITVSKVDHIGNRRFKYSVFLDDKFFSYRYSSVKEFNT